MDIYVKKHSVSDETSNLISKRYHSITKAINREFWDIDSDDCKSLYVGSYGRGTAISTSDIDVLVNLPQSEFDFYNNLKGNSQSRLLQAVRKAILVKYPQSDISADGQVVDVCFSDGMVFEILPAFENLVWPWEMDSYIYPDTNNGGKWRATNPKAEQKAMKEKNDESNGLLFDTCKHIRFVRNEYFSSYHLAGIVIDSVVYKIIGGWHWTRSEEKTKTSIGEYERYLYNQFERNKYDDTITYAPGSNQQIQVHQDLNVLEKIFKLMSEVTSHD